MKKVISPMYERTTFIHLINSNGHTLMVNTDRKTPLPMYPLKCALTIPMKHTFRLVEMYWQCLDNLVYIFSQTH